MARPTTIGVFRSHDRAEAWLETPTLAMVERVMDGVRIVAGDQPDQRVYLLDQPQPGAMAHRVGQIVVETVDDPALYTVQQLAPGATEAAPTLDLIGAADLRRTPPDAPGSWVAQAVVFDRGSFDYAQATTWLTRAGSPYRDYGAEERPTAYVFPQYDPKHFQYFKQVAVAPGVSVIYGMVGAAADAAAKWAAAWDGWEAMRRVNQRLATAGLPVAKAEAGETAEERFILGLVLAPTLLPDGSTEPDTQGDVYTEDEVRKAAHDWAAHYGLVDLMHNWKPLQAAQVQMWETYLAPQDLQFGDRTIRKGSWLLGLHIVDDALWQAVKDGTIGAYSIGGTAVREPYDPDAPPAEAP